MSQYRLLRNNKENGPFNLNDLINFGLKPYDLVWVDGKSAAWRYPSELQELKPYAPSVEEQPFDRFFKKETGEKKKEVATDTMVAGAPAIAKKEVAEERKQQYIPKRSVAVTLPSQKKVVVQKPVAPKPLPEKEITETIPTITVTENPAAQVKYSQPLDEIKEMYVKTLQQRKTKNARKEFVLKNMKRAAIIAGLIASGLLVGLLIKSGGGKDETVLAQQQNIQTPPEEIKSQEPLTNEQQSANNALSDEPTNEQKEASQITPEKSNVSFQQKEEPVQPKQALPVTSKKETTATAKTKADTDRIIEKPVEPKSSEKDPATGERSRVIREDNNSNAGSYEKPLAVPAPAKKINTWGKSVSVNSNDYKRVAFGGIRNLELTVTNDSKNVIEKVIVEVQYLKSSDSPFRTEKIEFKSIAPNGGTQTLRMPDTNRGAKVSYRILDVQTVEDATASTGF